MSVWGPVASLETFLAFWVQALPNSHCSSLINGLWSAAHQQMKKISSSISLSSGSTMEASRLLTGGWKVLEWPLGVGLRILKSQGSLGRGRRLSEEMGLMASSMSMREVSYLYRSLCSANIPVVFISILGVFTAGEVAASFRDPLLTVERCRTPP